MKAEALPVEVRKQNPWWEASSHWQGRDASLSQLRDSPVHWIPDALSDLDCSKDLIYTLRGPRQVGKTTSLKLLISRLIHSKKIASKAVFYLDCERCGWDRHIQMSKGLRNYLEQIKAGVKGSRICLFLDEVTSVRDWSKAIKVLADEGSLKGITVVATGSHAVDLKRGTERMPGRRGAAGHLDRTLFPLSFREFLEVVDPKSFKSLSPLKDLKNAEGVFQSLKPMLNQADRLSDHFQAYLKTGGFPRSVAAFLAGESIPNYVYEIYQQSVLGTVHRLRHREAYFRELLTFWLRVAPNPLDWRDVSRETDIGKHDTVREYVEDLELAYLWDVCYRSHTLGNPKPAFRSPKKIHMKDPFLYHALRAWVYGFADPWKSSMEFASQPQLAGALVESIVASALKRLYGPFLYYWRNHKEIDLLGFRENRLDCAVEVKYQAKAPSESVNALSGIGGGILLTSQESYWNASAAVAAIPTWAFLTLVP